MISNFSFETPVAMLPESVKYNSYEYALAHLVDDQTLEENAQDQYTEFYMQQIKHRLMILDNSAFELGESMDIDKFEYLCRAFANINSKNLWYIVPDFPGDVVKTIQANLDFPRIEGAKRIGVIQGNNLTEYLQCAESMITNEVDCIAIPMLKDPEGKMDKGAYRYFVVQHLDHLRKQMNSSVKFHLLGCNYIKEYLLYKDIDIFSADTSNPILHGLVHQRYGEDGVTEKSPIKLADLIYQPITSQQHDLVKYNLQKFFEIVKPVYNHQIDL